MSTFEKLLIKILRGQADAGFSFDEIGNLLTRLGFNERVKGSHHIYSKNGIDEIINLQPKQGKAKAYQVKQVRDLIVKYKLDADDEDNV